MIQNPSVAGSGETVTITVNATAYAYDNEGNVFGNGETFFAKKDIMIAAGAVGRTISFSGNCTVLYKGGKFEIYLFIPHGDVTIIEE
ncbi:hypothetical protein [Evtepia sp.]|uniref:hypothetical protein n=1 Tax=Evtepia sp. TaxID=2773933 RepID=UPI0039909E84